MFHKANYIALIEQQIADIMNEKNLSESKAFSRLAAEWIGYELDDEHFTDGKSDRGVDFWAGSDDSFEFFQVKCHELTSTGRLQGGKFDNDGVNDLRRIRELLTIQEPPSEASRKIQHLVREWNMALAKKRLADEPAEITVIATLVVFGEGLTDEANAELNVLEAQPSFSVGGVPIHFDVRLTTLDDLVRTRWRQVNREWKDRSGKDCDTIDLRPEMAGTQFSWIPGHSSAVFYCRAVDLIRAFDDLGYQIFEPNVRAHIRRSKINAAIRASIAHHRSRKEFRFLNNGVTITCKTFKTPTQNRPSFRVTEPGVVNGLQTVVAMHQEYAALPQNEKADLEETCYVLVRLLRDNAVKDIGRVVLATNTQNPMQARNLRSNAEEQVLYERLFAEMGWFYERKQGAWDAFSQDSARWRTLSGFRKSDFRAEPATGSKIRYRRVDNEELAQTWLAFIGFSDEAVHRKRELFDDDELYQLIFLSRSRAHGSEYDFALRKAVEDSDAAAPAPQLMLVSHLAREIARGVPLSSREAREAAIDRLNLDRSKSPEVIAASLAQDFGYRQSIALNGMSFLFCDFVGYVLYRTFGQHVHYVGPALLRSPSAYLFLRTGSVEECVGEVRRGGIQERDILPILWFAFDHIIDELLAGAWGDAYTSAPTKSKFIHRKDTRSRVAKAFNDLEEFMARSQLTKGWAAPIKAGQTITEYIKGELEASGA